MISKYATLAETRQYQKIFQSVQGRRWLNSPIAVNAPVRLSFGSGLLEMG